MSDSLHKYRDRITYLDLFEQDPSLVDALFTQAPVGLVFGKMSLGLIAPLGRSAINPMFESIVGRSAQQMRSLAWTQIIHPKDLPRENILFEQLKAGKIQSYDIELRVIRPDGSHRWVHLFVTALQHAESTWVDELSIWEDISRRKQAEETLNDSERLKSMLLDTLPGMVYRCKYDRDWTMEFASQGCFSLTGYQPEDIVGNRVIPYNDLILPQYRERLWNKWTLTLQNREKFTEEYEICTAFGEIKWVWEQGQGVFDESGRVTALEGMLLDITTRKKHEKRLKHISEHDQLTGLYNRRHFEGLIRRSAMKPPVQSAAGLLINIRKFTLLNNTYGYDYGDALIKEVATRLTEFTTQKRLLFHISIDRFILYVQEYENRAELSALCEEILRLLQAVLEPKIIGANIGVMQDVRACVNTDTLMKNLSVAAETAGMSQSFAYGFYTEELERRVTRADEIKSQLATAIFSCDSDKLYLRYQPIVCLRTNTIRGLEALARFQSDTLGPISPHEFIPIAEETQLIVPMGRFVMRMVCAMLKRLSLKYHAPITVSFNVSAIQLLRDDFISDLDEVLKETGADPHMLGIELTESVFADNLLEVNDRLSQIRKRGIEVSLDDFGTGYSSLARQRALSVDTLKIDRSFIEWLTRDNTEDCITADIISIAHKVGQRVIAEGVEHVRQRQYLIEHDCDMMQGFLFSEPVGEEQVFALLHDG